MAIGDAVDNGEKYRRKSSRLLQLRDNSILQDVKVEMDVQQTETVAVKSERLSDKENRVPRVNKKASVKRKRESAPVKSAVETEAATTFSCRQCSDTRAFTSRYRYEAHMRKHIDAAGAFSCVVCGESFETAFLLTIHGGVAHPLTAALQFACVLCDKRFTHKRYLSVHSLIHTGEQPFACAICDYRFAKKSNLNSHLRTHEQRRDDAGNYLPILPRGGVHRGQARIAMANRGKVDAACGPDSAIGQLFVDLNSKACDTEDLDEFCRRQSN